MLRTRIAPDELLKKGFEAASRAEYARALQWYEQAAKAGSAEAATCAAEMYETGLGMKPRPRKAARWYAQAGGLEKNLTPEEMLARGFEAAGQMAFRRALYWYERAAKAGSAEA